ncbi:MAG: glycine betaine/L-proline ABC transporter ATP-binding protein [Chloroflexi bacterium]|nr:glycine betaine/L-proline ABC transporter ATP-binding protein [Chloroflexota bacterium]
MSKIKITCANVWKIFGPTPEHIAKTIQPETAVSEILEKTGHVVAVRDVSFDVKEGEIFCVMGLSGSGKSTLIRCLTRLIEPTLGEIMINGENVVSMSAEQLRDLRRRKMSMVFQRFGLFSHRRVIDNIAYGLEIQGVGRSERHQKANEILELVGLHGWAQHYPHELSGGMQQRVGLARALAVDPEILLCDEPFSALDPLIRRDMQNELIRLQQDLKKTLVFITHDFLEALKLGDRIAIMKDGAVVQIGTPEQIVAHPINDYVAEFTKDVPRVKVLTARTVMQPIKHPKENLIGKAVAIDTTLEQLIPLTANTDDAILVMDGEENLVGQLNRKHVMMALATVDDGGI